MELVLLNLFLNSVDAMPKGGTLTVTSRLAPGSELKERWPTVQEGPHIELIVRDTGIGMDSATKDRIFEPFFTTKEMGRGTGLGLASVYGAVHNHGGQIQVDSHPGEGTAFMLLLPAVDKEKQKSRSTVPPRIMPMGNGKILLVDDEALILKYCHEMIESLGYPVVSVNNGSEAVQIYQESLEDIDLVVLDMVMPGMDGLQVFEAMKAINPGIKVIVTSGYTDDDRLDQIVSQGPHGCLKKPYTRDELARLIAKILGPQSADASTAAVRTL